MTALFETAVRVGAASRTTIDTPALVLDLDRFEHNVATMARFCRDAGLALRPHAKTHKSSTVARRQIAAGAIGIACATIEEAEVMVAAGLPGVLITSPLVSDGKIARLAALLRQAADVMVVADDAGNVARLDAAAARVGRRLGVLVDLDLGQKRVGVPGIAEGVALARAIAAAENLRFAGVQTYAGHLQHVAGHAERAAATRAALDTARALVAALGEAGLPPAIVTGGGTGTFRIDARGGDDETGEGAWTSPLTELQPGSYVVMDAEYADIQFAQDADWPFVPALTVQVTVISTHVPGQVTTDGGSKAFSLDGPAPRIVGPLAGGAYAFAGDEYGRVSLPAGVAPPPLGSRIECIVPHCDPTIALYDEMVVVRGDAVVAVWPIDARGRRALPRVPPLR